MQRMAVRLDRAVGVGVMRVDGIRVARGLSGADHLIATDPVSSGDAHNLACLGGPGAYVAAAVVPAVCDGANGDCPSYVDGGRRGRTSSEVENLPGLDDVRINQLWIGRLPGGEADVLTAHHSPHRVSRLYTLCNT